MIFEPPYRQTVHYTTLEELPETHWLHREFKTYLREMPAMLAAGREGKWVLIHGDEVVEFFDAFPEASKAGAERFFPAPYMVMRVREYEPVLRVSHPGAL